MHHQAFFLPAMLALLLAWQTPSRNAPVDPFPLSKGTYWVYRGIVRYGIGGSDQTQEKAVTWRMDIEAILPLGDGTAAVVKGLPSDLDWSDGTTPPKESILIQTNAHRLYFVDEERAANVRKEVEASQVTSDKVLTVDDLWFRFPLVRGDKSCGEEEAKREDGMYCSIVDEAERISLAKIKGAPVQSATAYTVAYRTNPDDQEMQIVPGVGIISYAYHHHGTIADTEVNLVEFHPGS